MAQRVVTEATLKRYRKEGRGEGHGAEFVPAIKVSRSDFPSRGRSHIQNNLDLGRQHHLLSDLESGIRLSASWISVEVADLREQYELGMASHEHPLRLIEPDLDADLPASRGTLAIARELGIRHPWYHSAGEPRPLSTDLVLTVRSSRTGAQRLIALTGKYTSELDSSDRRSKRRYELLEIERRYWRELGVYWSIITEEFVPKIVYQNLIWISEAGLIAKECRPSAQELDRFLQACAGANWEPPLRAVLAQIGACLGWSEATAIATFKHCLWYQLASVDLTRNTYLLTRPAHDFRIGRPAIPSWHFAYRMGVRL